MKKSVKIWLWGGLGDCLATLTMWKPLQDAQLHNPDMGIFITYGKNGNDCGWINEIRDLCFRIPILTWVEPSKFDSVYAIDLRNPSKKEADHLNELFFNKEYCLMPDIALHFGEKFIVNSLPYKYIAIQLSSNDSRKVWGRDNFAALIERLLEITDLPIVLLDAPTADPFPLKHDRIISMIGCNFPTSIRIVANSFLLISADSWSKYAARWKKVNQVILCSELEYISPVRMINECFGFLKDEPNVDLIGVRSGISDTIEIVNHVKKIPVEEALEAAKKYL